MGKKAENTTPGTGHRTRDFRLADPMLYQASCFPSNYKKVITKTFGQCLLKADVRQYWKLISKCKVE